MDITYDPTKDERNVRERGLSFESAAEFDFSSAVFVVDDRRDYGETRVLALGYLRSRLHMLCFTGTQTGIRIISFRKANAKEIRRYERAQTADR